MVYQIRAEGKKEIIYEKEMLSRNAFIAECLDLYRAGKIVLTGGTKVEVGCKDRDGNFAHGYVASTDTESDYRAKFDWSESLQKHVWELVPKVYTPFVSC